MTPPLAGLLFCACLACAGVGLVLRRDTGPLGRLGASDEPKVSRPGPLTRLGGWAGTRFGPSVLRAYGPARRARVNRRLDLAGRPGGMTLEGFVRRKATWLMGAAALTLLLTIAGTWFSAFLLLPLGWWSSDIWLARRGRQRQERLERDVPDFLDVLSVTVRAGLGYRGALVRVASALGGPVGDEITAALRQMELGASRREAFLAMRDRNDSPSLDIFVTTQLQAEELGVPLADALVGIAKETRREAHQNARRRAQRAAPRVSLVVTMVIVPASILLILVSLLLGSGVLDGGLFGG